MLTIIPYDLNNQQNNRWLTFCGLNQILQYNGSSAMLANPQKFQAILLNCEEENFTFDLDNVTIIPDDVVKLLGVNLDSKLN